MWVGLHPKSGDSKEKNTDNLIYSGTLCLIALMNYNKLSFETLNSFQTITEAQWLFIAAAKNLSIGEGT